MPQWDEKPGTSRDDALHQVLEGLEDEVSSNPSFAQVTGIPLDRMMSHSTEAISLVFGEKPQKDLDDLIQVYAMGFVIGMKFAAYQLEHPDVADQ